MITLIQLTSAIMSTQNKKLRTCSNGHHYYKTSDCPVCPICERENKPGTGFLSLIPAPARRALQQEGITTLQQLSKKSENEILKLHGIGPAAFPPLRKALAEVGLSFKK